MKDRKPVSKKNLHPCGCKRKSRTAEQVTFAPVPHCKGSRHESWSVLTDGEGPSDFACKQAMEANAVNLLHHVQSCQCKQDGCTLMPSPLFIWPFEQICFQSCLLTPSDGQVERRGALANASGGPVAPQPQILAPCARTHYWMRRVAMMQLANMSIKSPNRVSCENTSGKTTIIAADDSGKLKEQQVVRSIIH